MLFKSNKTQFRSLDVDLFIRLLSGSCRDHEPYGTWVKCVFLSSRKMHGLSSIFQDGAPGYWFQLGSDQAAVDIGAVKEGMEKHSFSVSFLLPLCV